MADFLLIHGSCHGAWCWRDVIPALEAQGHSARAIDLPGHNDGRDLATVTLAETAQAILAASTPDTIVLGHSWAGFPISAAAELDASALRGLIYLCAYVPLSGQSLIEMRKAGPRQTIGNAAIKALDGNSYTIDPTEAPRLFYQDCPSEAVSYALPRLCAQPILPQDTPLRLGHNWHTTPKAYIRCTKDQTIPPEYQAQMVADWPRDRVHEMHCSHSPFFADPERLADLIGHIAKDF
ncbi:alpha/beta fold hydrolase [Pseudophaeobacter sp. EL27]|uniref:alpha/beta fold hydrolase n=1 Tax=Pseudophaeobacter sp. EL27 TaxID=2107580 RepID=UPI000EFCEEF4|nr:alpha/beta fold hydrolase [Pseudophaeobacter sp. EL27]